MLVSSVPLSLTHMAGLHLSAMAMSSSRATRAPEIEVSAISRNDMMSFHQKLRSTPRKANLALAVLSKAFALAEQWQLRPEHSNPCRGVGRFPEQHRERFLSLEELKRLGQALELAATTGLPWRS
jgi:hypothetical protein